MKEKSITIKIINQNPTIISTVMILLIFKILCSGREGKKVSATSKTSFNRFSPFVKSGAENYILGKGCRNNYLQNYS